MSQALENMQPDGGASQYNKSNSDITYNSNSS